MASGVPCIATCVGGLTDLMINNINGLLIMPNNVNQLISSIEYLYNNRKELIRMRRNGLEIVRVFGKKRWEKDILSIVKGVYG
jgi:glycosyltransferase involved in cell wall biosynthesis